MHNDHPGTQIAVRFAIPSPCATSGQLADSRQGPAVNRRFIRIGILATVILVAGGVYVVERQRILADAFSTFDSRAHLIAEYMALMGHTVQTMKDIMEKHEHTPIRTPAVSRVFAAIEHFPGHDTWGVSGLATEGGIAELNGSLTGRAIIADPPPGVRRELEAAIHLDQHFGRLLENVPETIWVYYTSASGFIHIAPDPPVKDFRFSETMYTKPFWTEAAPAHNPEQRQIISELYDDYYGQGLMISISSPVRMNDEFVGVVSVDLGIDLLRELTGIGQAVGESMLVDQHDQLVASIEDFKAGERLYIPDVTGWKQDNPAVIWLAREVVADELRLVHRLPRSTLAVATLRRSLLDWIALLAVGALLLVSIRLHEAYGKVRQMMHRDPLTGLLNRRGFERESEPMRRVAWRRGHRTSLVLFDIDFFKQVNDTHGHGIGDEVLTNLARRLMTGVDEHDRVCRWGGEEILVLLVHDLDTSTRAIADRLRASVAEAPLTEHDLSITVSGGLTEWTRGESLAAAVKRADDALYRAKSNGRNRVETGPPANR